jgi:hypothetical protein
MCYDIENKTQTEFDFLLPPLLSAFGKRIILELLIAGEISEEPPAK